MFFTPELLAKRDSGFGLLWLAATLGSRSAFKKLPKRSVLTADIAQLCDLISEPAEPLALRLSSNLMFGVVRVYKVKQELFYTDVTNCVTLLKKVVQDMHSMGASAGQLQMQNPVARPSTLTIVANPNAPYVLDFDAFVANWDEYLNIEGDKSRGDPMDEDGEDDDFDPTATKKRQLKGGPKGAAKTEAARKEAHTLEEHHEHLLSASFDLSFDKAAPGDISSSQAAGRFDDLFAFSDGLDLGEPFGDGLGDDLARELGWGASPAKSTVNTRRHKSAGGSTVTHHDDERGANFDMNFEFDFNGADIGAYPDQPLLHQEDAVQASPSQPMIPPTEVPAPSPATSFANLLLSQDIEQQPIIDLAEELPVNHHREEPRKHKRTRLLLDARTELTDDELKIARAKYLEFQNAIRRDMLAKRMEKEHGRAIDELIWGAPKEIQARGLIQFWQHNFKVQVEARSGIVRLHEIEDDGPAPKRRKPSADVDENIIQPDVPLMNNGDWDMDWLAADNNLDNAMVMDNTAAHRQSSEEPGQARRISRSASVLGSQNFGFDLGPRETGNGSQRSSLFPWDNAGPSSSTGNDAFPIIGDEQAVAPVDIRMRSSSLSRHDSPLASSLRGSLVPQMITVGLSPTAAGRNVQIFGEDFAFDVDNAPLVPEDTQQDTQKSDLNLITLERNSFNFLEYAKMQHQALPGDKRLTFEVVVPKMTSTRHVAAAAFYHCLVLATKNLIQLEQKDAYEPVIIAIV